MTRSIRPAHQFQTKFIDALLGQRQADETPPMRRHEVDGVWCCHLGRDDKIALIFPIFIIHKDEHAPIACFFNNLFNRDERRAFVILKKIGFKLAQRLCGRVPIGLVQIAKGVGMQPGGTRQTRARQAAVGHELAEFFDELRRHGAINHIIM